MAVCFLRESDARRIRQYKVREDLIDVSENVQGLVKPLFVSYKLVRCLNRHDDGMSKLKSVLARAIEVYQYNRGKKTSFIIDLIPKEFFTVERSYNEGQASIVIDGIPLSA